MKPKRIQRKRTKGWKMPANAVYVGRPTKWGNPFTVSGPDANGYWIVHRGALRLAFDTKRDARLSAVNLYRKLVSGWGGLKRLAVRRELRGKDLACWCGLDDACHADILLEVANW